MPREKGDPRELRRSARAAISRAAAVWSGTAREGLDGRFRLDRLVSPDGAELVISARGHARPVDLAREAKRLSECERSACLVRPKGGGAPRAVPLGCSSRVCPVCLHARSMRAFALWRPVVEAAAADGATFYHVTLTQPTIEREGGAVTPEERRRGWKGQLATAGEVLAPVAGEGLYAAHTRLRDSLKRFRSSRKTRDVYYDALGGYLQAFEATGQSYRWDEGRKRKMGLGRPRWHVHTHILAMCPRGGREVDALRDLPRMWASHHRGWDAYGERWSTRADCQRIRRIEPERAAGDDALTHAVLEVLKYPFKTDTLTSAQLVEVLSVTKGMRFHQAAGGFYSRAGSGVPEPYASWLAARAAPTAYDRLYVVQREVREDPGTSEERPIMVDVNLEQSVFTGQPRYRAGWHWFRWGENGEPFAARGDQLSAILAGAEDVDPVVDDSDELVAVAA